MRPPPSETWELSNLTKGKCYRAWCGKIESVIPLGVKLIATRVNVDVVCVVGVRWITASIRNYTVSHRLVSNSIDFPVDQKQKVIKKSQRSKSRKGQKVAKVKKKKTHRDWIKSIYPWKPYKKRRDATKNSLPQLEVYKEKKGIEWIRTRVSTFIQLSHARQMFRLSKLIFSFSQNINCPISRRRHQKFTKVALHFWDVRPIRSWREADSSCRVKFNQVDDGIGGIFFTVSNALRSAWCGDL